MRIENFATQPLLTIEAASLEDARLVDAKGEVLKSGTLRDCSSGLVEHGLKPGDCFRVAAHGRIALVRFRSAAEVERGDKPQVTILGKAPAASSRDREPETLPRGSVVAALIAGKRLGTVGGA
jgi:hypothetical protein